MHIFPGNDSQMDARRAFAEPDTNIEVKERDFLVLMATVSGRNAYRNLMIPAFAKHLRKCDENEDLYALFLKTQNDIQQQNFVEQVAICKSTFRYKLCIRNIFCQK